MGTRLRCWNRYLLRNWMRHQRRPCLPPLTHSSAKRLNWKMINNWLLMKEVLLSYVNVFVNFALFGTHYKFWYDVFSFTRIFRVMEKDYIKNFGFTKFLCWKKKQERSKNSFSLTNHFVKLIHRNFICEKSFSRNFYTNSIVERCSVIFRIFDTMIVKTCYSKVLTKIISSYYLI